MMKCFTIENSDGKYAGVTHCDVNRRIAELKRRYKRYLAGNGKWDDVFIVLSRALTSLTIVKKLGTIKNVEVSDWCSKMKSEGWTVGKYKLFKNETDYNKNYYSENKEKMMKQIDDARKIRRAKQKEENNEKIVLEFD